MAISHHLLCLLLHFTSLNSYILPTHKDFLNDNKKDWAEAELHCISIYDSHLLSIHDSHSFQSLRNKIIAIGQDTNHFWIGLVNIADESVTTDINYSWTDDTSFDFGTDLISGSFPWFDERPETPTEHKNVRLWGGSASLLWDDTHHDNEYFWICNDAPSNDNEDKDDDDDGTNSSNEPSESMESGERVNTTLYIRKQQSTKDTQPLSINGTSYTNNANDAGPNDSVFTVQYPAASSLDTFWKFALMVILAMSACIIVLRMCVMYRNYKTKRRASSIGIGPRQITDISVIESANSHRMYKCKLNKGDIVPKLHFSSIDQREDTLDMNGYNEIISPFTASATSQSDDLPQIPIVKVSMADAGTYSNNVSLEIEHDVTSHIEGLAPDHRDMDGRHLDSISDQQLTFADSLVATFDVNTTDPDTMGSIDDLDDERRSILLIMEQNNSININHNNDTESYEDTHTRSSSKSSSIITKRSRRRMKNDGMNGNRSSYNSIHSTMAAFDARSFKLKDDDSEWNGRHDTMIVNDVDDEGSNVISIDDEGVERNMDDIEYGQSAETSDDGSETNMDDHELHILQDVPSKRESELSVKEIEIKSNISQIMENLKRMKNMSMTDASTVGTMVLD